MNNLNFEGFENKRVLMSQLFMVTNIFSVSNKVQIIRLIFNVS